MQPDPRLLHAMGNLCDSVHRPAGGPLLLPSGKRDVGAGFVRSLMIEIGQSGGLRSFVRALDEGGMVWEGKIKYRTMDEALQALKNGIAEWTGENC